jgi:hypothetical protein
MSGLPLFRTLAIPLGIALLFLIVTPKLCQRALVTAKVKQHVPATPAAPAPGGLIISSSTPAPRAPANLQYPPGLDAARIQYLVEIDQTFAAPLAMPATGDAPVTKVLLDHQYIEKRPDGTFGPTREGLINVNGAVDSPAGWIVPIARRKVVSIDSIDDAGDGTYNASIRWRWEPALLFNSLLPAAEDHLLTAEYAGGEGHWALRRYVKEPDREFR